MRWVPRTAPLFALFWLLLSGHYEPLLLSLGAFSIVLVCWLTWRAGLVENQHLTARGVLGLPRYLGWLAVEVLRSAVAVVRVVWSPRVNLRPAVESIPMPAMSPLGQVIYANSITLTPGTLALDVYDDRIKVHSLDPASLVALRTGAMVRRVQRLEGGR